jgi:MerR family mercuric resistance operon transcriptional regulator
MKQRLTIGKVAAAAEVNVETIRFYQRRGLLAEPEKETGGFRHYGDETIQRVRFIKRAQAIGFSLEEIKDLITLNQVNACKQTHDAAVAKLEMVETQIADLNLMKLTLKKLIKECETGKSDLSCPIIDSLGPLSRRG